MVTSCHITALKAGKHPAFCREIKHNSSMDLHICLIMFVFFLNVVFRDLLLLLWLINVVIKFLDPKQLIT